MNNKKSYSHIDNHNLIDVIRKEEPLYDYSKLHTSVSSYDEYSPTDKTGIQLAILSPNKKNQQIRVRGGGHSMSGISLPQQDELLIRTRGIEHYRFEEVNTTTVGAGALVWDVRDFVRDFGLDDAQKLAASSVLKDVRKRAEQYVKIHTDDLNAVTREVKSAEAERRKQIFQQRAELVNPLNDLFAELRTRLEQIPTEAQRSHAEPLAVEQPQKNG